MWIQVNIPNDAFLFRGSTKEKICEICKRLSIILQLRQEVFAILSTLIKNFKQQPNTMDQSIKEAMYELYSNCVSEQLLIDKTCITIEVLKSQLEKFKATEIYKKYKQDIPIIPYIEITDLYLFGKKLDLEKKLHEYIGKNEKTKINVKLDEHVVNQLVKLTEDISIIEPHDETKKRKFDQIKNDDSFFNDPKFRNLGRRSQRRIYRQHIEAEVADVNVTEEQLSLIGRSNMLKNKLRDERLQKIILDIDMASNRERKLDEMMDNDPDFVEFIDEILYLIGEREELEIKPSIEEQIMNQISMDPFS